MILKRLPDPIATFQQYAGRTVVVPMSGGADSTLLAACAMRAGCNVELLRLDAQTPSGVDEKRLAPKLYDALSVLAKECNVKLSSRIKTVPYDASNFSAPYTQMAWWLSILPVALSKSNVVVAMGWLASDGTKTLAEDFRQSIVSTRRSAWLDDVDVIFPLLEWTKDHVLTCLSNAYPTLVPLVWWCENGAQWRFTRLPLAAEAFGYEKFEEYHEQCGKCHSCVDTLAFFQHWDGKRMGGDRGYAPMDMPPDQLVSTYPRILVQDNTALVADVILLVAKHYGKRKVTIELKSLVEACSTPPYVVVAVHPKFGTDNRTMHILSVVEAIMDRRINPTNYQRAIEHLAYYTLRYLEMDSMKSASARLKEIANLLKAETDTLWPIPQWYLDRDVKKEIIKGV